MGQTFKFICKGCGYSLESTGDNDCGMIASVKPYICKKCNDVVDVITGKLLEPLDHKDTDDFNGYLNKCPRCKGDQLTEWDIKNYPCPKCGDKMNKGLRIMLWD